MWVILLMLGVATLVVLLIVLFVPDEPTQQTIELEALAAADRLRRQAWETARQLHQLHHPDERP